MNFTPFNPEGWIDIVGLLILSVASVLGLVLPIWLKVRKIDEQVTNSHDENLRVEITRGFKETRADIEGMRQELRDERASLAGLRDDLKVERRERIKGDKDKTGEV